MALPSCPPKSLEIQPTIKPQRYTKALRRPVATAPKARA